MAIPLCPGGLQVLVQAADLTVSPGGCSTKYRVLLQKRSSKLGVSLGYNKGHSIWGLYPVLNYYHI